MILKKEIKFLLFATFKCPSMHLLVIQFPLISLINPFANVNFGINFIIQYLKFVYILLILIKTYLIKKVLSIILKLQNLVVLIFENSSKKLLTSSERFL